MIDGDDDNGYALVCDNCGDDCGESFVTFFDAVEYKRDRDNGWRSVKDKNDAWFELCPSCNQPGIIADFKGTKEREEPQMPKRSGDELARLAGMDTSEFEGF